MVCNAVPRAAPTCPYSMVKCSWHMKLVTWQGGEAMQSAANRRGLRNGWLPDPPHTLSQPLQQLGSSLELQCSRSSHSREQ